MRRNGTQFDCGDAELSPRWPKARIASLSTHLGKPMRLVIDMQGAQTGSRYRGIGRYSMSLTKAIARNRGRHELFLALSGLFPETIDPIRAEFSGLLPAENIRVWNAIGPTRELESNNQWRREVSERIREAFLASLQPDVILISSLFEGLGDDGVGSIGILKDAIPTAVILYDLIPLLNPDEHFRSSRVHKEWYQRKIRWLRRSKQLLAISESSRQEALSTGYFNGDAVINISGGCDDSFRVLNLSANERQAVWQQLGISRPFVMYTGGADERKNLHRLIEAYAQMPASVRHNHQLVLAGKMPNENVQQYLQTAGRCGLSSNEIVVTGYVEDQDLLKLYNTCTLFVFPSLHEGFGLPPLEAMACGAAVIGANATSLTEVIGLDEAMFNPVSISEIASKMTQALSDTHFRARLLAHGKHQFRRFTWDSSAKRAIASLEAFDAARGRRISSLLSVERTACFERRRLTILVVKLDHLGDFILAIPALTKLRAKYPYASIDIVVGSWNTEIAKELKFFRHIFEYNLLKRKSSEHPSKATEALAAVLDGLDTYDIAIDLRRQPDTRFFLTKTRADIKIGYETFDNSIDEILNVTVRAYPDVPFKTTPLNQTPTSIQMLSLIDATPRNVNDFISFPSFGAFEEREHATVAIFPKAGMAVREWDRSNFVALVDLLAGDSLVKEINVYFANNLEASEFNFPSLEKLTINVGLSFDRLSRSLSRNNICIANNSGGAHLASYLGLTVIGIYSGHELPSEWGPQFFNSNVIHRDAQCSPCHGAKPSDCPNGFYCLSDISVDDIYSKTIEAIVLGGRMDVRVKPAPDKGISLQRNSDLIVKNLIASIVDFDGSGDQNRLLEIARVVSRNHPTFSISPDLGSISPGSPIDHKSGLIEWVGFSGIEPELRWTDGNSAAMIFDCPDGVPAHGVLTLLFDTLGAQRLLIRFNGVQVVDAVQNGSRVLLKIPVDNLESGRNTLEFDLPDARIPSIGDSRKLAIAIKELEIQVERDGVKSRTDVQNSYRPLSADLDFPR
jgi:glycosyltransferase involved in cell wall biosynthesis/ADP-heptose:LPS heptosyltransferase